MPSTLDECWIPGSQSGSLAPSQLALPLAREAEIAHLAALAKALSRKCPQPSNWTPRAVGSDPRRLQMSSKATKVKPEDPKMSKAQQACTQAIKHSSSKQAHQAKQAQQAQHSKHSKATQAQQASTGTTAQQAQHSTASTASKHSKQAQQAERSPKNNRYSLCQFRE